MGAFHRCVDRADERSTSLGRVALGVRHSTVVLGGGCEGGFEAVDDGSPELHDRLTRRGLHLEEGFNELLLGEGKHRGEVGGGVDHSVLNLDSLFH